ncbi:MAG: permease [Muribaculaceae bacterium]|nr:permease [Muribaculaceae bacterium]
MELLNSLLFMLNEMSPYILLGFFIAGVMHAFVPQQTFAHHLSGTGWKAVVKSTLIGIPLPLCSCGVLPTAIAMHRNGASRASTTSFLIATPQTGVDSIAATWSLLGPAFAVIRPVAALVTAILGGVAVGKTEREARQDPMLSCGNNAMKQSFLKRVLSAFKYGYVDLVGSIGGWLVAGLIIAALITVYVPADFFSILGSKPIFAMIAVLIIAVPMYVCATGSIPIAMSLILKGLSPGTALVLLMAGPAANFASFTLISREIGRRAALIYLVSIVIGSIIFGLTVDYMLPSDWFNIKFTHGEMSCHTHQHFNMLSTICSVVMVLLLIYSFVNKYFTHHIKITDMTKEYNVKGVECRHCQATVTKAIANVKGVTQVEVDLKTGKATVEGNHNAEDVVAAVRAAGFDIE